MAVDRSPDSPRRKKKISIGRAFLDREALRDLYGNRSSRRRKPPIREG